MLECFQPLLELLFQKDKLLMKIKMQTIYMVVKYILKIE